ncbi:MAG: IPT/TIG domain-containing protein [Acidimicrobiales bacterium]
MTRARSTRGLGSALTLGATALLAMGVGLAPAGAVAATNTAGRHGSSVQLRPVGIPARLPLGARVLGDVPAGATVRADIVLQPLDGSALTQYATSVSSPRSGLYRHYLSPAAFSREFAPTATTRRSVQSALVSDGLRVLPVAADGLVIPVEASASRMEAAFHTGLDTVRLENGRLGQWAAGAPRLPADIAANVLAVLGLNELVTPTSFATPSPTRPAAALKTAPSGSSAGTTSVRAAAPRVEAGDGAPVACAAAAYAAKQENSFTDDEVAHAYGFDGLYSDGVLGAGQTVALFEEDVFAMSDLKSFDECYLGADHTNQVSLVNVDGGEPPGYGGGEATLDVEDVSAYAPAAHIDVYDAPSTLIGWVDEMAAIVNQDLASVINVSYGLCETQMQEAAPGLIQTENILFEEAALQGQSFVVASGDAGSETCFRNDTTNTSLSVSDPASQPFAISVGGTSLKSPSVPPVETVWNDGGSGAIGGFGENGAGGGGISQVWPMPAWQAAATTPGIVNSYSTGSLCGAPAGTDCREVPDVTASADELHGDTIYYGGGWMTIGGTSASAPKWAALLALTNNYCATLHLGPVGFASPALYQIASNPVSYAEAFNDITVGTNDVLGAHDGAYPATVGFDLASGLGSPRATGENGAPGLASLLCSDGSSDGSHPSLSAISPSHGSYTGGTTVTLTGTNLASVTAVQFGPASESVSPGDITDGGTQITLDTPASPTQPFDGGTPVGGVLVQVSGTSGTSAPSLAVEFHYLAGSDSSPVPSVDYISPTSAPSGSTITIYGSGFEEGLGVHSAPTVEFGGIAASGVTVVSDTELTAQVPAQQISTDCATVAEGVPESSLCQVEVTVTNSFGTSAVQTILPPPTGLIYNLFLPAPGTENVPAVTEFDYAPAPVISSVSPDEVGSTSPFGTDPFTPPILTVTGTGFNYFSLQEVEANVPSDPQLDQTLFVGIITATTVEFDVPEFSPGFGPAGHRADVRAAGDSPPTSFQLSIVSAGIESNVVTVPVAPGGISVSALSAHDSSTAGGRIITVTGSNLEDVTGIAYYGTNGLELLSTTTDLRVVSDTELTFLTPAAVAGSGFMSVCDASVCAGEPPTTSFAYYESVQPVVTGIAPPTGSAGGGEAVTIAGTGLGSVTAVKFGSTLTKNVSNPLDDLGYSTTAVKAVVPPGTVGARVAITVITLAGTSQPAPVTFTYEKGAPGAPVGVAVLASPGMGTVSWSPPVNDGGSPIVGYSVSAHIAGEESRPGLFSPYVNVPAGARSVDLPVSPYVPWVFHVKARTAIGSTTAIDPHAIEVTLGDDGYAVAAADGTIVGYGDLGGLPPGQGGTSKPSPIVDVAVPPNASGYWTLEADGTVSAAGTARSYGSLAPDRHTTPLVALVAGGGGAGGGYWIVTAGGGVFGFGDAHSHGSVSHPLVSPIVSATSTTDGGGYWMVGDTGNVFAFGDARNDGSLSGHHFTGSVVAIIANPTGNGYWVVTSTGGVYPFGGAEHLTGLSSATSPVVSATPTPDGGGCWLLEANGSVRVVGDARFEGEPALESRAVAVAS